MHGAAAPGALPGFIRELARPLPRLPLALLLTGMVRRLADRRPDLFERLGQRTSIVLLIDPVDLPFRFRLLLAGTCSRVDVVQEKAPVPTIARVRAPLVVLLGLLDGSYDADALFFTRDLAIEGDVEAVLALRNAIEEAALTPAELFGLAGPFGRALDRAARQGLALLRRSLGAPAPSVLAERGWR